MTPLVDAILYNGNIHTLWDAQPHATAIAIKNGRVVALGTDEVIRALAPRATQQDLNGATVIPGLIDAHVHWQWTAEHMHSVNVFEVPSKAIALERVAERATQLAPGEWVRGHGWLQDLWDGRTFPTAADLDTVAPQNPVYLTAKSSHAAWVNTAALQLAGVDANTPEPTGGTIMRDGGGNPNGILLEAPAMRLVADLIPARTPEQIADQMLEAQRQANAQGLTAIHDLDNPECLAAMQILRERGQLSLRVTKYINKAFFEAALASGVRFGLGDDWIRFGGLKLFADGALGPRTAYMLEPYEDDPHNYGIVVTPKDEMLDLACRATLAGLPTAIHAIGDRAVREVVDIFDQVRAVEAQHGIPRSARRHRIEHVQIIDPTDAPRLAALDLIASMQPNHATSDAHIAERHWGDRAKHSYHIRQQIDAGARVAFGSDTPIEPFDPINNIHAAVTRQRPDGSLGADGWYPQAKLTVDEAIRGFTVGAAYAAGLEDRQGRIAPNCYADLVILDRDPYSIAPHDLLNVNVVGTMVDGMWRHNVTG